MNRRHFLSFAAALALSAMAFVSAVLPIRGYAATSAPLLDVGGSFNLTTHTGEAFTQTNLKGKAHAIFFGFTNCPEVCPTTLFELTGVLQELGGDADQIVPVFITVDPARDTPQFLTDYLSAFDSRIIALYGSDEETATAARAFKATYKKVPLDGADYTMDHTAIIYLMDRNGHFFDKIDYREDHQSQIEKIRRVIAAP